MATSAARGLHPSVGFLVAWGYALVGLLIPPLLLLQFGFTTAATLNAEFHGYPASLWWPWAILGALIVLAAGFYGIRTPARLGRYSDCSRSGFSGARNLPDRARGQPQHSVGFTTKYTRPDSRALSGVIGGSVYTILAFGGFEGAAPPAEETRNPRRTIQRAVLLATLLSALSTCSPPTPSTSRSGLPNLPPSPPGQAARPGRAWRGRSTGSSGSSSSWPSSTPPSRTPMPGLACPAGRRTRG
jgi:hypothetical protein